MSLIRRTGDKIRNAHILRDQRNLERADFIDDVTIHTNRIRRGGEYVDLLVLHHERGHIIGDHRYIEAHIARDRGGQTRALKIRTRFRTEQMNPLFALARDLQHLPDDRFSETLRHHAAVIRKHIHEVFRHFANHVIPQVVCRNRVLNNCIRRVLPRFHRTLCRIQTAAGHELHSRSRGRARV